MPTTPSARSEALFVVVHRRIKAGHADERGTADLNMDLSDQRLKAVWRFLRGAGYAGRVSFYRKESREFVAGVDRSKFPAEVLWQLDRRVELIARAN